MTARKPFISSDFLEERLRALGSDSLAANFRGVVSIAPPPDGAAALLAAGREALRSSPRDARLHAACGRLASWLGDQREAVRLLRRALVLGGAPRGREWLAEAYLLQARPEEALAQARSARREARASAWAGVHAAGALCALGRLADARAELSGLLAGTAPSPARSAALALSGLIAMGEGRRGEAEAALSEVVRLHPREAWPLALRSRARGGGAEALADLEAALRRSPSAWLYLERCALHRRAGRPAEALADLDAALAAGADKTSWYASRAELLRELGRAREAGEDLGRAVDREAAAPGSAPGSWLSLARRLLREGRTSEAERAARREMARGPESAEARLLAAECLARRGRPDEARRLLARTSAGARRGAAPWLALSRRLLRLNRTSEAEAAAAKALAAAPASPAALLLRAECLARLGRGVEAEELLARSPRLRGLLPARADSFPAPAAAWREALRLLASGDFPGAKTPLAAVLEASPAHPEALEAWGRLRLAEGRFREAEDSLRRSLAADPARGEARLLLAKALLLRGLPARARSELASARRRLPRPESWGATALALRYRVHANLGEFALAEAAAERALDRGREESLLASLADPFLAEEGEAKASRRALASALSPALQRYAAARPGSPWPSFFRARLEGGAARGEGRWAWMGRVPGGALLRLMPAAPAPAEEDWKEAPLLMRRGDLAGARRLLEASRRLSPRRAELDETWGRLLLLEGRVAQAAATFRRAARRAPPRRAASLSLAESLLLMGRDAEARRELSRAARLCPPPASAEELVHAYRLEASRLDLAAAARAGEAVLDATRDFERLKGLRAPFVPDQFVFHRPPPAYEAAAREAADALAASRPASPWGPFFRRVLHKVLRLRGEPSAADAALLARLAKGRYAWMAYELGKDLLCAERFAEAERVFRTSARAAKPLDWPAQYFAAESRLCRGDLPGALAALRPAGRAVPADDEADALAWRGELLLFAGRYREALPALEEAARRGALYAQGWRGAALLKLGRAREALAALDAAIAAVPEDLEARLWRAEALRALGRTADCLAELEAAAPLNEHERSFYFHAVRGLARGEAGDAEGLRADFEAALAPERGRPGARPRRGESPARALERILRESRGVRRGTYEMAIWLGPKRG